MGGLGGEVWREVPARGVVEGWGGGDARATSRPTDDRLPEGGAQVVTHTELLVGENESALRGCSSTQERELYRLLVKVDGVGPKLALAALGALSLEDLVRAIRGRDVKALTRIPGVGKKTAEKMCFELSEKLGGLAGLEGLAGGPAGDPWEENLRSAMTNLGFKEDVVLPVVADLRASKPPLAEAIRLALKALQR